MDFFRKMSFADSTGDAIPFIMKVNIIFFTDIPARNHGISGETAYYLEPLCFGGSGTLGGAADSTVSGRGR